MKRPDGPTLLLGVSLAVASGSAWYLFARPTHQAGPRGDQVAAAQLPQTIPFDGAQAYQFLRQICLLGPRPSGSEAIQRQQQLLIEHFTRWGAKVSRQPLQVRHPEDGSPVPLTNLIVEWHPDRSERILLCAHYDTRPFPDRDQHRPRGVFVGANDGASGVALLMELGKHLPKLNGTLGVDFVLFDGEEFVFDDQRDRDYYFIGSTHFARNYRSHPPPHRYRWGVLLDLVGDAHLDLYFEQNSLQFARPLVHDIWNTANRLGVSEFRRQARHELRDDHLPLNEIARIPTCDIIDFDYPRPGARESYWHTESDTPDKCSPESLAKVGWVLLEWLHSLADPSRKPLGNPS